MINYENYIKEFIENQNNNYWNLLDNFVKKTVEGRDESHGHSHMEKVALNSIKILLKLDDLSLLTENNYKLIVFTSWLHDISDHKYDSNGKLKSIRDNFIKYFCNDSETNLIIDIIESISYSKEKKEIDRGTPIDWKKKFGEYQLIRNIVSDADKLEAIGKIGIIRCIEYSNHKNKLKYKNKSVEEINKIVKDDVNKHAEEKLLKLKDDFIHTKSGKELAQILHNELIDELEKFNNN